MHGHNERMAGCWYHRRGLGTAENRPLQTVWGVQILVGDGFDRYLVFTWNRWNSAKDDNALYVHSLQS